MPTDPRRFNLPNASTFAGGTWEPKYPEFALPSDQVLSSEVDQGGSELWKIAPASSHVEKFRYWSRVRYPYIGQIHDASLLEVVFKERTRRDGSVYPRTRYRYWISDDRYGWNVYLSMASAESPWEIGYRLLEQAGVPYERVAVDEEPILLTPAPAEEDDVIDLTGYEDEPILLTLANLQ